MKLFDTNLVAQGLLFEAIFVRSFDEYKAKGGEHDMLDCYAHFKEKAKDFELCYIENMDAINSGIPFDARVARINRYKSQIFWLLITLWFNKPLRIVDYNTFSLEEFNKL
jgi:hypothetical protein